MSKNAKAMNILHCGLSNDIYEYVFHCKSAKEIWNYLYFSYDTKERVLGSNILKQEDIKESAIHIVGDGNDSHKEQCEMTNADKGMQNIKEDGLFQTRMIEYSNESGQQRELMTIEEQIQAIQEQDSPWSSNLENEKNDVKASLDYFSLVLILLI